MIQYDNILETMDMSCDIDDCETSQHFEGTWASCIDQAKQEGWKIMKGEEEDEWTHVCYKH